MLDQQEQKRNVNKLADLKPDQNNARKHNPRNIGMVANSLREVGAARSGVIDEDGNILAGNGTYEALSEAGIEKVKIVQADGNEWVVVQRKGLSEKQKLKLALYDNRSAELAEWDKEVLADIDPEIMESMFSTDELEDLLDNVGGSEELDGEDDVPEAPEKAISQLGDLYQLGQHRLLCGDSSSATEIKSFLPENGCDALLTDPPYGIGESKGKNRSRSKLAVAKDYGFKEWDNKPVNPLHLLVVRDVAKHQIVFGGNFYDLPASSCWLVWDKENGNNDFADCELAWTNLKKAVRMIKHIWNGMIRKGSEERFHPTQKPIAVLEWCIGHLPDDCKTIFDPFGGSGSTLIASEKLSRKCYMMELDPQYCDVIVKRFNGLFPEIEILRNGEAFEPIHE